MSLRKTTTVEKPHATFRDDAAGWEWRVLKTYQPPAKERRNPYAVWYLAVRSPFTLGSWEYGDGYVRDVGGTLVQATDEWREAYGERGRP